MADDTDSAEQPKSPAPSDKPAGAGGRPSSRGAKGSSREAPKAAKSSKPAASTPPPADEPPPPPPPAEGEPRHRQSRLAWLTSRLTERRDLAEDTRELLGAVLETSDKAKTEVVKLVAREVRNYLEELKIKDDLKELVTSHSLEVKLSLRLEPKDEPEPDDA